MSYGLAQFELSSLLLQFEALKISSELTAPRLGVLMPEDCLYDKLCIEYEQNGLGVQMNQRDRSSLTLDEPGDDKGPILPGERNCEALERFADPQPKQSVY